jgi:NAD(P)-dependent dehydrogenase (short-subunit alcohol dehydrogenase family)
LTPRPLSQQVFVLTGASSGVGRETALQLAEHGATIVSASTDSGAVEGDFGSQAKSSSLYTELLELHPQRIRVALAAAGWLGYRTLRR